MTLFKLVLSFTTDSEKFSQALGMLKQYEIVKNCLLKVFDGPGF